MRSANGKPERGLEGVALQRTGFTPQLLHGIFVRCHELRELRRQRQCPRLVQSDLMHVILIEGLAGGQFG